MFQNILHFLLNWPVLWGNSNVESFVVFIFILINIINALFAWAGFIYIFYEFIEKKLKLKKIIFYLIYLVIFPLSSLISLFGLIIICTLIILIGWIFDVENGLHKDFFNWVKSLKKKQKESTKQDYKDICISNCKYGRYLNKLDSNNKCYAKCDLLDMEFSRDECPCGEKLFEG